MILAASPSITALWMTAALMAFVLLMALLGTLLYYRKGNGRVRLALSYDLAPGHDVVRAIGMLIHVQG